MIKKDSTSSKFGQALVANSAKQAVLKQQMRDRLRAKLGKSPVEHEVQINAHGVNIARVNLKKDDEQFRVEGVDQRSKFIFAYMDMHGVKYEEAAKAYEEGVRYWLGLN
jgi:uncharacterized protein YkuJ